MRIIGIHLSISGGPHLALEKARELRIEAMQIFLKNSNRWSSKPYADDVINKFKTVRNSMKGLKVFAHAGYLINCAGSGDNYRKSLAALSDEMGRAAELGIDSLVLHPGSHGGKGMQYGIERAAEMLGLAFQESAGTTILLETTAGQGSSIGYRFEHLRDIIDKTGAPRRLGICLDTCHVFAAGYNFTTKENLSAILAEFDEKIGLGKLKLIHINDSKRECGSRIDRHEHIGKGHIGSKGLALILNAPGLRSVPMVLETPKFNNDEADRMNLKKIRRLIR